VQESNALGIGRDVIYVEGTVREPFHRTSNYAWVVFAGICLCSMSVMVLGVMIFGVYLVPLAEQTGAGLVAASLYMTIYGWVMAVGAIVWGFIYSKWAKQDLKRFRLCNVIVVVLGAASPLWNGTVAPAFGIMGYYFGAAINGLSGGCFMAMVPIMMITEWFGPKYRGKFMGIASAAAIIGATIWPPLFTYLLQNMGMNMAYIANALALFVCAGIPALFIFRYREEGVLPWGVKSHDQLVEQEGGDAVKYGFPPKKLWFHVMFWLGIVGTICFTLHGSMAQNLVGATTFWLDDPVNGPMIGAVGMSVASIGECVWKILAGVVIDKIGPAWNNTIFTGVAVIGLAIWVWGPKTIATIYIAGAFFGAATVPIILGGPLLATGLWGPRCFPIVSNYGAAVNTFFSGLTSPLFAMFILGYGYTGAFAIGVGVWILPIIFGIITAVFFYGKIPWYNDEGEALPNPKVAPAQVKKWAPKAA
jgi:MFS family permease